LMRNRQMQCSSLLVQTHSIIS